MKPPAPKSSGLPPRQPNYQVESAAEAIADPAPGRVSRSAVAERNERESHPARKSRKSLLSGVPTRGLRIPDQINRQLLHNRDRYNADRDQERPRLTLDEQAILAFQYFLDRCKEQGTTEFVDRLRTPDQGSS